MLKASDENGAMLGMGCTASRSPVAYVLRVGSPTAQVIYRVNSDSPFHTDWPAGKGVLFVDTPLRFIESLRDNDRLFLRAFDFQGTAHDATFMLADLSNAKQAVGAACGVTLR